MMTLENSKIGSNASNRKIPDKHDVWNSGAIVIDKYGNVAKEAKIGYYDNHGAATVRAAERLKIVLDKAMGVIVANNANLLDLAVFHTEAKCLFVFLPSHITEIQNQAIHDVFLNKQDFCLFLMQGETRYSNISFVEFYEFLNKITVLEETEGISR